MKLKSNFVLRQIAGTWVVMPLSKDILNFDGMLSLNETGVALWLWMEKGLERESLVDMLTLEYDVSRNQALADIDEFITKLKKAGCIQEESRS